MSSATAARFVQSLGLEVPTGGLWGFHVQWGTRHPADWVTRRNALEPHDLLLTLSMSGTGWTVGLQRHDGLFQVAWRSGRVDVESQQMRYRVQTPWPVIAEPREVPSLARDLEDALDVRFWREVNMQGSLADQVLAPEFDDSRLLDWLRPSAEQWSVFGRR